MSNLDRQLIEACTEGDLPGVQAALVAGADVHADADDALCFAARGGHLGIVSILLNAGAEIHAGGDYPLRIAAQFGHLGIVQLLLGAGAELSVSNNAALNRAVSGGHLQVVKALLEAGADANEPPSGPLREAIRGGFAPIVVELLEFGAPWKVFLRGLPTYSPAVQVALLASAEAIDLSVTDLAKTGVCPDAICVLLDRQGHTEVATILKATQMLEPMAPEARYALLVDMLPTNDQPESHAHVGP